MSTGFNFGNNVGQFGVQQTQGTMGFVGAQSGFQISTPTSTPNLLGASNNSMNFKPGGISSTNQLPSLFAIPSTNIPTTGLNIGGSSSTNAVNTGFGFGTGSSFPISTATSTGLSYTTTPSVTTISFGTPTMPTLSSTTPLSSSGFNTTTNTSTSGFNFGPPINKAPVLGTSAVTTTVTGPLTFGLSDNKTSTLTSSFNQTTTTSAAIGLGGLASQTKPGTIVTTQKEVSPKEQPLPNEILQTVEQFKEKIKEQKLHSSDIARCSVRDFRKVETEIDLFNNMITDVETQLQKNRHLAEKLKYDTAKCLHDVEIAQRTQDTPPGLQYENTAPLKYFLELADHFEREMQALKIQIESADKYVKNHRSPDMLTPQDLALGMRRLHETFVALAGRLQAVHGQVEAQKELYFNLCKHVCSDSVNPFDNVIKSDTTKMNVNNLKNVLICSPPKVATGPTPFNNLSYNSGNPLIHQQNQLSVGHSGNATNPLSSGLELSNHPSNISLFGNVPFGQTSLAASSTNFQLQKPPTGNKRGKQ